MSTQGHTADPSASMQAASRTHSTDDCPDVNIPYGLVGDWPDLNLPYDPYFFQAITSHSESPDNHQRNVRMRVESQPPRDNFSGGTGSSMLTSMSTQGHPADPSASLPPGPGLEAASRTHSTDDCPDANMPYVFWECWRPDVNLPYDPYFVSTSEQAITSHLESPDNHQRNVRMRVESQPPRDNISVLQLSGSSMPEPPLSPPLTPTSNSQTCTRAISSTPPTLECPICMKPLVEQMATRCGHMFCEGCIRPAIAVKAKCPICRDDVTLWELRRIYFS